MTYDDKIKNSLFRAHAIIKSKDNIHVLHTSEIDRQDRELLIKSGWLEEIIRGWYLLIKPDKQTGDSSGWYANFWDFLYAYLEHFYGTDYCLSAENSLDLQLGNTIVPEQVVIMAPVKGKLNCSSYMQKYRNFCKKQQQL